MYVGSKMVETYNDIFLWKYSEVVLTAETCFLTLRSIWWFVQGIVVRFSAGARFCFVKSVQTSWRSPCLLFSGYQGPFLLGWSDGGMKLTTRLHLKPRLGMTGVAPQFPPYPFVVITGTFFRWGSETWLLSFVSPRFICFATDEHRRGKKAVCLAIR
jgi:hypothetical protein